MLLAAITVRKQANNSYRNSLYFRCENILREYNLTIKNFSNDDTPALPHAIATAHKSLYTYNKPSPFHQRSLQYVEQSYQLIPTTCDL